MQQACAERDLAPPLVQAVPATRPGAQAAIAQLLAQTSPPFGVCCYNDEVAFAVLGALSHTGIAIPEAVAVIGCDDIPLAEWSAPPLTTLRFDNETQLDRLVENILAASQGEPLRDALPSTLSVVVRASA